jgi:mRNA interferase MazF
MTNKNYPKGQIVDVDLGLPPGEVKGHEQGNLRPCVVVKSLGNLGLVIIVPCTSKEPKVPLYTVVRLNQGSAGLTTDSFALCHQIRTVSISRIVKERGRLDAKEILKIHSVIADTLEL